MLKEITVGISAGVEYVKIPGISDFDVNKTFDCGQCFRFDLVEGTPHEAEFAGVAFGRFVSFAQDGDTLYVYKWNRRYPATTFLDLDPVKNGLRLAERTDFVGSSHDAITKETYIK